LKQKIIPHLWFDKEAQEAARFYASVFGDDSGLNHVTELYGTPSGTIEVVLFTLWGYRLMAISAGPLFKFNPSISFMVNFDPSRISDAKQRIDAVWDQLAEAGRILMPIGKYPFSERYGWVEDKYGLSWQLILTNPGGEERPPVIPSLLFVGALCGKAEEATDFYLSVFRGGPSKEPDKTKRGIIARYPKGMEPDRQGTIMFTDFNLHGGWFAAMDSAQEHAFGFNEAISLMVNCETQEEIDYFWEALSAVPESEQCGWLKDQYGVSWQIVPTAMDEMMNRGTREQIDRVTQAFLGMKKFDIAELRQAFEG